MGDSGIISVGHDNALALMDVKSMLWCCVTCCWVGGFFSEKKGKKFVQFSSRNSSKERWGFIHLFPGFLAETTACLCLPIKKGNNLLITKVLWEASRKQSGCPRGMLRKINTKPFVPSYNEKMQLTSSDSKDLTFVCMCQAQLDVKVTERSVLQ